MTLLILFYAAGMVMMRGLNIKAVRLLALVGFMLVLSAILLWNTGNALKNTTAVTDDQVDGDLFSQLSGFANRLSISLFLILIILTLVIHLWHRAENNDEIKKNTNRAWIAGVAAAFIVICGLIIYVDPRGLYGTNIYEPRLLLVRDDKLTAYTELDETPDIVVLGSSRAFTMLPEFFEQDFGYSAFNMSVEGGRMEDYEMQTRYILDHDPENLPKVLLIEITPPLLVGSEKIAQRFPLRLLPYMDNDLAKKAIEYRVEGLLDLQQFNEAIYALRYYTLNSTMGSQNWTFGPDGGGIKQTNFNLQAAVQRDIVQFGVQTCPRRSLSPEGVQRLEAVVELAEEHNIAVIFYVPPRHPDYFEQLMAGTPHFRQCQTAMHTYMDALIHRYPFVFFLDYPRLANIGGVADETGYYDSQHMTPLNNHYLLNAAADTIRQAYTVATQQRAQPGQSS